jgi:hypothetical protein
MSLRRDARGSAIRPKPPRGDSPFRPREGVGAECQAACRASSSGLHPDGGTGTPSGIWTAPAACTSSWKRSRTAPHPSLDESADHGEQYVDRRQPHDQTLHDPRLEAQPDSTARFEVADTARRAIGPRWILGRRNRGAIAADRGAGLPGGRRRRRHRLAPGIGDLGRRTGDAAVDEHRGDVAVTERRGRQDRSRRGEGPGRRAVLGPCAGETRRSRRAPGPSAGRGRSSRR